MPGPVWVCRRAAFARRRHGIGILSGFQAGARVRDVMGAWVMTVAVSVFPQVARMQLDTTFDGLTIGKAGRLERSEVESQVGRELPDGIELFVVGSGLDNHVLSQPPAWHEDQGTYRDPSSFGRC
jgi:hypothetical protein